MSFPSSQSGIGDGAILEAAGDSGDWGNSVLHVPYGRQTPITIPAVTRGDYAAAEVANRLRSTGEGKMGNDDMMQSRVHFPAVKRTHQLLNRGLDAADGVQMPWLKSTNWVDILKELYNISIVHHKCV